MSQSTTVAQRVKDASETQGHKKGRAKEPLVRNRRRVCQMKYSLIVAISVAALSGAQAGFKGAPDLGSSVNLICRPPLDRNDRNPVVKTFVNISFKNGYEVEELSVIHERFDGQTVDRSKQYSGTVAHVAGHTEWSWSGRQDQNRHISMEARVFRTARNEWFYEENISKDGHPEKSFRFGCTESEGGD
jgi:hypothetical protein